MKRHTVSTIIAIVSALIIVLSFGAHFDLAPEYRHVAPLSDSWVGFAGLVMAAVIRFVAERPRKRQ